MRRILWTSRARADLRAIRAFISQESPHVAGVVIARIVAATERIARFPESGRTVPEFRRPDVREVIHRPYQVVYRLVGANEIHVLTVHHAARRLPRLP